LPDLDLIEMSASYGDKPVLQNVSLSVRAGEVVSIIGPSGSGKSTLLRVLVGLLKPTRGQMCVDGHVVNFQSRRAIRDLRDRVAIVFQQYNLFQNMTVLGNVTVAPIRVKRRPPREVLQEGVALLERVGLADKLGSYPDELSGGQQQRVAIARALALKPEFLLLDEITAALDPELVRDVLDVIRGLAQDGMTMLIVSHEMGFVREVSSRVVFMVEGKVLEEGIPAEVFDNPRIERTRDFMATILRH
jgi:polar amino acid transport system ATP-binding protein